MEKKAKRKPTGNYKIGFAAPPAEYHFPKGKSGYPKGRPRKDPEAPIIDAENLTMLLSKPLTVMKNGVPKKLSPIEARAQSMVMKALTKQSIRAIKFILDRAFKYGLLELPKSMQPQGVVVVPRMKDIPEGMEWALAFQFGIPKDGIWSQVEIDSVRPHFELQKKKDEAEFRQHLREELAMEQKHGR